MDAVGLVVRSSFPVGGCVEVRLWLPTYVYVCVLGVLHMT